MVGGLLNDRGAGVFALQIHAGRDEAVASCTALRAAHVLTVDRHEPDKALHRLPLDGVLVLTPTVLAVDGVLHKGHVTAEPGADPVRILLVADPAADAIQGQAVRDGFQQGVVFRTVMVCGKVAHWRVAAGAFVLQACGMSRVGEDLMAHLGPPEGILGAVGHDGTPPIVDHVHVPSIGHGVHRERLAGDGRQAIGILPVAPDAFAGPPEQGVEGVWQSAEDIPVKRTFQTLMVKLGPLLTGIPHGPSRTHGGEGNQREEETGRTAHGTKTRRTPRRCRAGSLE